MDLRPLLGILASGSFHSGEKLGGELQISRTAVWKQVERLRSLGVEVHSVTGKGYRIPAALSLLNEAQILAGVGASAANWEGRLDVLFSTGSTNVDAMEKAQSGADRYIVVAEHQSQGKGRRGRTWVSPLGANIYFSMLVSFQSGVAALEGLSLVVALLVARALERCGCRDLGLKWPNDILVEGKKLAGILLEISGDVAGPCKVVIGIGLNVRMPSSVTEQIDQPFTDLERCFSGVPDRNYLVAQLILELEVGLAEFSRTGFSEFYSLWQDRDIYKGRMVELRSGGSVMRGIVHGINHSGALLLETDEGLKVITGGEVVPSLRPVNEEGEF